MGDNKQIKNDFAAVLKNLKIKVTENSIVPLSEKTYWQSRANSYIFPFFISFSYKTMILS